MTATPISHVPVDDAQAVMDDVDSPQTCANIERHSIIDWLERRIELLLEHIQAEEFWTTLISPSTKPEFIRAIMAEQYLQIVGYQTDAIEAAIAAIGQMPRSLDPRHVRSMLVHQSDEWDHGEMALRDFVGLGGSESEARSRRMSPEAFAVAGVWWLIARKRDPFAYLGALYLFEGLTPRVTGMVKPALRAMGMGDRALEYIEFHSTEDIKHANLVHHLISRVATQYPGAVESMKYGYECFEQVYPLPVWRAAYLRAKLAQGR